MSSVVKPGDSPILCLPTEIRQLIYGHILPKGEHVFLDYKNGFYRDSFYRKSHFKVLRLLLSCKTIQIEVAEFIFRYNIVHAGNPIDTGDLLHGLGHLNRMFVTTVECTVKHSIGELGSIWKTIGSCPRLEHLRIAPLYYSRQWLLILAEIAPYIRLQQHANKDTPVQLDLAIYNDRRSSDSISRRSFLSGLEFQLRLTAAASEMFTLSFPRPLRRITVMAMRDTHFASNFDDITKDCPWRFVRASNTQECLEPITYRWVPGDAFDREAR